jgi:cell division protein ZapA (FtsZ GTPase activity inhibitor)
MSIAVILALLLSVEWAGANARHRSNLDRKQREVREWQQDLRQRFQDANREANQLIKGLNKGSGSKVINQTGSGNK